MEPRSEQSKSVREIRGSDPSSKKAKDLNIEGYPIGGLSIGGHETCIIFPTLKIAFDIGRCPPRAVSQDFLLISHAHMDHIGGLPMYVATRGLYRMKPPTIIVPISVKEDVEKLFEVHRKMDQSELKHNLIGLDVGEEFYLRKDLKVKAFQTYHVIPSQGYVLYSERQKLKQEYIGLSGNEIKNLKSSGVEMPPRRARVVPNVRIEQNPDFDLQNEIMEGARRGLLPFPNIEERIENDEEADVEYLVFFRGLNNRAREEVENNFGAVENPEFPSPQVEETVPAKGPLDETEPLRRDVRPLEDKPRREDEMVRESEIARERERGSKKRKLGETICGRYSRDCVTFYGLFCRSKEMLRTDCNRRNKVPNRESKIRCYCGAIDNIVYTTIIR